MLGLKVVAEVIVLNTESPLLSWNIVAITKVSNLLDRVLGVHYLDPWRACTLFLLLRRLSSEEAMSTRLTHDLGCNWTGLIGFPRSLL